MQKWCCTRCNELSAFNCFNYDEERSMNPIIIGLAIFAILALIFALNIDKFVEEENKHSDQ